MRHKTFFASIVRFPDRHGPIPPGSFRGRSTRFAAAMARVRRPVPFRTRKLRPCTAMVLHPRGCGRVARRRFHTIRFPPVEPPRAPGGFLFSPTHARAGRATQPGARGFRADGQRKPFGLQPACVLCVKALRLILWQELQCMILRKRLGYLPQRCLSLSGILTE